MVPTIQRNMTLESKCQSRRVALITGAGTGIGQASARALYQNGYNLVLAGRSLESLQDTAKEWDDESRFILVSADITQIDQVETLFQRTKERFGRLDILFNNAGIGSAPVPIDEINPLIFQMVMDTNVKGTFLCCQQAWTMMKDTGGRIINNGSISAHSPRPFSAPYTAAKHAITGLTKSLNLDGRAFNICCSQIDIGNAATPMTHSLSTTGALQPNGTVVVEPVMSVKTVADTILYLSNLPLDINVPFITIMATQMPFMGRG